MSERDSEPEHIRLEIPQKYGNAAVGLVKGGASIHGGIAPDGDPTLLFIYKSHQGEMHTIDLSFMDKGILDELFEAVDAIKKAQQAEPDTEEYYGSLPEGYAILVQLFASEEETKSN